jgi:hypothetical protein
VPLLQCNRSTTNRPSILNKLNKKCITLGSLYWYSMMHGQQNIKFYSFLISVGLIRNMTDVRYVDQANCLLKLSFLGLLLSNNSTECLLILYHYFVSFLFITFLIFSRMSTAYNLFSALLLSPYRLSFWFWCNFSFWCRRISNFCCRVTLMWLVWRRKTVFYRWLVDSQRKLRVAYIII